MNLLKTIAKMSNEAIFLTDEKESLRKSIERKTKAGQNATLDKEKLNEVLKKLEALEKRFGS